jgi:hypothetical protein
MQSTILNQISEIQCRIEYTIYLGNRLQNPSSDDQFFKSLSNYFLDPTYVSEYAFKFKGNDDVDEAYLNIFFNLMNVYRMGDKHLRYYIIFPISIQTTQESFTGNIAYMLPMWKIPNVNGVYVRSVYHSFRNFLNSIIDMNTYSDDNKGTITAFDKVNFEKKRILVYNMDVCMIFFMLPRILYHYTSSDFKVVRIVTQTKKQIDYNLSWDLFDFLMNHSYLSQSNYWTTSTTGLKYGMKKYSIEYYKNGDLENKQEFFLHFYKAQGSGEVTFTMVSGDSIEISEIDKKVYVKVDSLNLHHLYTQT